MMCWGGLTDALENVQPFQHFAEHHVLACTGAPHRGRSEVSLNNELRLTAISFWEESAMYGDSTASLAYLMHCDP